MADFFEGLGRKISDVANEVTKKTGDVLEVQKIKSEIYTLKRANERSFVDIGRMMYGKFCEGEITEIDCVSLCEEIEKREEKIKKLEEEIERIQEVI